MLLHVLTPISVIKTTQDNTISFLSGKNTTEMADLMEQDFTTVVYDVICVYIGPEE